VGNTGAYKRIHLPLLVFQKNQGYGNIKITKKNSKIPAIRGKQTLNVRFQFLKCYLKN